MFFLWKCRRILCKFGFGECLWGLWGHVLALRGIQVRIFEEFWRLQALILEPWGQPWDHILAPWLHFFVSLGSIFADIILTPLWERIFIDFSLICLIFCWPIFEHFHKKAKPWKTLKNQWFFIVFSSSTHKKTTFFPHFLHDFLGPSFFTFFWRFLITFWLHFGRLEPLLGGLKTNFCESVCTAALKWNCNAF